MLPASLCGALGQGTVLGVVQVLRPEHPRAPLRRGGLAHPRREEAHLAVMGRCSYGYWKRPVAIDSLALDNKAKCLGVKPEGIGPDATKQEIEEANLAAYRIAPREFMVQDRKPMFFLSGANTGFESGL